MSLLKCYHALPAFQKSEGAPLRFLRFGESGAALLNTYPGGRLLSVPCGKCIGCRLKRRLDWSIRSSLEASLYDDNCFVTLTYADNFLPVGRSLDPKHFTDFLKRFRFNLADTRIRYFGCGEYGDLTERPHYHAIIYGWEPSFNSSNLWSVSESGVGQYLDETLSKSWPFGVATVAKYNDEYSSYVAGYVCKKLSGVLGEEHYKGRVPDFVRASRRPGIGADWFARYRDECVVRDREDGFARDGIVWRGRSYKIPDYFLRKLSLTDKEIYDSLKAYRLKLRDSSRDDLTHIMCGREFQTYETLKHYNKKGKL